MRVVLFALLLSGGIRGDVLECRSEMNAGCVAETTTGESTPRQGEPPEMVVTDSSGNVPDVGKATGRGDHSVSGLIMIPIIMGFKLLGLIGGVAVKHFILKAILLAKISLLISGWLIYRAMSQSAQKYKDLLPTSPNQYPQNEPDLSGYGYMSTDGYQYNHEDLIMAALNKTLMSRPGKKWRVVPSDS